MNTFSRETGICSFSAAHPFAFHVSDGEIFWVETYDCYCGQVTDGSVKRPAIDRSVANRSTGPIEIVGAMPGDTLCIEIKDIELFPQGFMVSDSNMGFLGDTISVPETQIVPIRDGKALFSDTIHLPLTPMIGACGVAPKDGREIHCAIPGDHGANMDCKMIKKDSKLYLPVAIPGAGLAIGDLHACMGDGELSGTGIEISGKVCVKASVLHAHEQERPIVETKDALYFIASATTIEDAMRLAASDAVRFLQRAFELPYDGAYRLLSAVCDIQICQLVNKKKTARICCPKFDPRVKVL